MSRLIPSRYKQGLAAYRAGHGVGHLMEVTDEVERSSQHAFESSTSAEQHEAARSERNDGIPSVFAGFVDGLLDDIRLLAAARRGGKA